MVAMLYMVGQREEGREEGKKGKKGRREEGKKGRRERMEEGKPGYKIKLKDLKTESKIKSETAVRRKWRLMKMME
jgi:hypothetical protein